MASSLVKNQKKPIKFQVILKQGTGFFGRPTPYYWEARQAAWSGLDKKISALPKLSAGEKDFIRICILYLAELAEEKDKSGDRVYLGQQIGEIQVTGESEGVEKVKDILKGIKSEMRKWNLAKGFVGCNNPSPPEETKINNAFAVLEGAFAEYLSLHGKYEDGKKTPGRKTDRKMLRVLSGMSKYIEILTGRADYPLLFGLTVDLHPPLGIAGTANRLRPLVHAYRKRERSDGTAELTDLKKEFDMFCKRDRRNISKLKGVGL